MNVTIERALLVIALLLEATPVAAQLSPPGLGEAETAAWMAAGVRQDIATRFDSVSYLGFGTISHPHDADALRKPAMVVLNEEISDQFHPHWRYSLALSYRHQCLYADEPPYARAERGSRQELRVYGRLTHVFARGRFKLSDTIRPELRSFFAPGLHPYEDEPLQLRARARSQLAVALDAHAEHRVVGSAEVLASTAKERGRWTSFAYRESRFCLYYSLARSGSSLVFDLGYMNNLIGYGGKLADVHYLAFDVVWKNPFSAGG